MKHRFGKIQNGEMILNELGQIAHDEWMKLLERFPNMEMDAFQIMPNHMHGIIELSVRATLAVALKSSTAEESAYQPLNEANEAVTHETFQAEDKALKAEDKPLRAGASPAHTEGEGSNPKKATLENSILVNIGEIVGSYKSLVSNECLELFKARNEKMGKLWHRNYYEHIIKNEQAYQNITKYIINNPAKWEDDKFYKK